MLPKSLQETIKVEYMIWADHFSYIKMRKDQCTQKFNPTKKITRNQIEDSFYNFVANQLEHVTVEGYTIYFSLETLDMDRENSIGETNLDLMKLGFCPIGSDGQPMNYHHLTHHDYATHKGGSIIVLLSDDLHTKCSGVLHFGKNTYLNLPRKKVERNLFSEYRISFNKKIADSLS